MNIIYEKFDNINELLFTLDSRPNNEIMKNKHSSNKNDTSFSKTSSYAEAADLLENGYLEILPKIKDEVRKNNKIIFQEKKKIRRPQNMPIGFIPNVPNALQNKPDSMINILSKPQKIKTLSVIYAMGGSAFEDAYSFVKAGAALVSALNLIESYGIQTRLYVNFMPSIGEDDIFSAKTTAKELACPILRIKNFGERFNLTKVCFPLAHPSMFRRIGFKWLETSPKITCSSYANGYGRVASLQELKLDVPRDNQTFILDTAFIKKNEYNIKAILKELKIVKDEYEDKYYDF